MIMYLLFLVILFITSDESTEESRLPWNISIGYITSTDNVQITDAYLVDIGLKASDKYGVNVTIAKRWFPQTGSNATAEYQYLCHINTVGLIVDGGCSLQKTFHLTQLKLPVIHHSPQLDCIFPTLGSILTYTIWTERNIIGFFQPLFSKLDMDEVIIFHDDSTVPLLHKIAMDIASVYSNTVVTFDLSEDLEDSNLTSFLLEHLEVIRLEFTDYIVLCSSERLKFLLNKVNKIDSLRGETWELLMYTRWIVVLTDNVTSLLELQSSFGDVTNILLFTPHLLEDKLNNETLEYLVENILVSLKEQEFCTAFDYNDSCQWLQVTQFMSSLKALKLEPKGNSSLWRYGVYTRNSDLPGPPTPGDSTRVGGGLEHVFPSTFPLSLSLIFPNSYRGFHNRRLRVAISEYDPYAVRLENSTDIEYDGLSIKMIQELQANLNFSVVYVIPADGEFGAPREDGSWTGVVGLAHDKMVDIVASPLYETEERWKVMDFTSPWYHDYAGILIQMPDVDDQKWRLVVEPFRWHVWTAIFLSIPFTSLIVCSYSKLARKFLSGTSAFIEDKFLFLEKTAWYLYGAMLTQGGAYEPQTSGARVVIGAFWLYAIVMVATYGGNLIAFLSVSKQALPFETLSGMLNQNQYKYGLLGGSAYPQEFQKTNVSLVSKVYKNVAKFARNDPKVLSSSRADHLNKVMTEKYALVHDRMSLLIERENNCALVIIPDLFFPLPVSFGLPKGSSHSQLFTSALKNIQSVGILDRWINHYWPNEARCRSLSVAESRAVSMLDAQSAFIVLAGGLFLSLTFLGAEFIHRRRCKRIHVKPIIDKPKEEEIPRYKNKNALVGGIGKGNEAPNDSGINLNNNAPGDSASSSSLTSSTPSLSQIEKVTLTKVDG